MLDFPARVIGLFHRVSNRLAEHELAPQQLNRTQRGRHHAACAELAHQARLAALGQKLFRQADGRRRQPRHHTVASAVEIGSSELVSGQRNRRFGIGHAQQCFGQTHQRQPFGAGNWVFLQQTFHCPERRRIVAHCLHPRRGHLRGSSPVEHAAQALQLACHDLSFRTVGKRKTRRHRHKNFQLRFVQNAIFP